TRVTAKAIEYPTGHLHLAGPAWPWRPAALLALTGAVGITAGFLPAGSTGTGDDTHPRPLGGASPPRAIFDPLTGWLAWLCRLGKCSGRASWHPIGVRLQEGHFTKGWLFYWL